MTRRRYLRCGLGAIWALRGAAAHEKDELTVIVHPSNRFDALDRTKVGYLFLRKVSRWPWGAEAAPVDLPHNEPIRREFVQNVLRLSEEQLAGYWMDERAIRGIGPPVEVRDAAAAKQWVAARPGAIAYIPASALDGTVKALRFSS